MLSPEMGSRHAILVSPEFREVQWESEGRCMQRPEVGDCPVHAGTCSGLRLCFESRSQQSSERDAVGMSTGACRCDKWEVAL